MVLTNLKMADSGLVTCFEVEQLRPCFFFGKDLCPNCYAEPLLNLRKANARHTHKATPKKGLVRLGTYIEVLPEHWEEFKSGRGTWDCCGAPWLREDFPTRTYFLVTRGLASEAFYADVLADPKCVNVQLSIDILPNGLILPDESRIRWFRETSEKVIFRFKTTERNARAFAALAGRLGIPPSRVMETPLREGAFVYGATTPLEKAGWPWKAFGRCNTRCSDCVKENGLLLCAAKAKALDRLASKPRPPPPRHEYDVPHPNWKAEAKRALQELGGRATVQELYAWFLDRFPVLKVGKPNWRFKVRVAVQRVGEQVERGVWSLPNAQLEAFTGEAAAPVEV